MLFDDASIPFSLQPTVADYTMGIYEIKGLLRVDGASIILEYRTIQAGQPTPDVQAKTLHLQDLQSVQWKKSFFSRGRLILEPRSLRTFEGLPGNQGLALTLFVPKKARTAAANLVSTLQLRLSEIRLDQLS